MPTHSNGQLLLWLIPYGSKLTQAEAEAKKQRLLGNQLPLQHSHELGLKSLNLCPAAEAVSNFLHSSA
ncbi:hypothetical protein V6N12_011329 [Hibiscus sabdariffa]|uniref:Uncharacterized protein n=1 Tax=Hibiscus sabdariffa TaxID=183260 RepID=A0ABR2B3J4_9ROSI